MRTPFFLRTDRLTIAEFTPEMAARVSALSLDEDNRSFMPDEVFETVADAAEVLETLISAYDTKDGPLVYPILRNGENIGHVEAVPLTDGTWEIGYHVGKAYTGKGYAVEAVRAFVPAICEELGISEMLGICDAENAASRRVLEKCGFSLRFEGMGEYHGRRARICRYARSLGAGR